MKTRDQIKAEFMEQFCLSEPLTLLQERSVDILFKTEQHEDHYRKAMKANGTEFIMDIPPREMFETHEYNDMKPRREEHEEPKIHRDEDKKVWNTLK